MINRATVPITARVFHANTIRYLKYKTTFYTLNKKLVKIDNVRYLQHKALLGGYIIGIYL